MPCGFAHPVHRHIYSVLKKIFPAFVYKLKHTHHSLHGKIDFYLASTDSNHVYSGIFTQSNNTVNVVETC